MEMERNRVKARGGRAQREQVQGSDDERASRESLAISNSMNAIYIYIFIYTHTYVYIHTHIYIYVCSNIYIYIDTHTRIHTYMHISLGLPHRFSRSRRYIKALLLRRCYGSIKAPFRLTSSPISSLGVISHEDYLVAYLFKALLLRCYY